MKKQSLEVLNTGLSDQFNVLADSEMDLVMGGNMTCKKSYTETSDTIDCGCGYIIDKGTGTTIIKTNPNDGSNQAG